MARKCKKCGAALFLLLGHWYCEDHRCHFHTHAQQ